jgi:hypothetical protein
VIAITPPFTNKTLSNTSLRFRIKAATVHLGISITIALLMCYLILELWYPRPFGELSGGTELLFLVTIVDVVLGPLITLFVFNIKKSKAALRRDLAVVCLMQCAALIYGVHTVVIARPSALVLEIDRVRVLTEHELRNLDLQDAPDDLKEFPAFGLTRMATREIKPEEKFKVIELALQGADVGSRPAYWLPAKQTAAAWADRALPLKLLHAKQPTRKADIDAAVKATGKPESEVKWLAILARNTDHTALIDAKTGDIVGYAPVDGN